MTAHRSLRSTDRRLAAIAVAAALMAAAPIGEAWAGPDGSGYEPSQTDCVNIAQQPARYRPDELARCGLVAPTDGYSYDPTGGYGYYPSRG